MSPKSRRRVRSRSPKHNKNDDMDETNEKINEEQHVEPNEKPDVHTIHQSEHFMDDHQATRKTALNTLLVPRTRKAKDTQTRLGVGRPIAAGGTGARVPTKSVSVSRGSRQIKKSRNVTKRPFEECIAEGRFDCTKTRYSMNHSTQKRKQNPMCQRV